MQARALALLILLSGCDKLDRLDTDAQQQQRDIANLREKVATLEQKQRSDDWLRDRDRDYAHAISNVQDVQSRQIDALQTQVNGNAKLYNEHLRAER